MIDPSGLDPATWAIVGGRGPGGPGAPLNVPPHLASNYVLGAERVYTRGSSSPTIEAFEELLGGIEGGACVASATGMAAVASVFDQLAVGARVVLPDDCYHGTSALADAGEAQGRWSVRRLAVEDAEAWAAAAAEAELLWLESPSNPLLRVADLPRVCAAPRAAGAIVAVDSTMATPLAQQPLRLGADVVVHSATKFVGGHSDLLLGAAVTASPALEAGLRESVDRTGATPGAMETFLALRGARTMPLRVREAAASAVVLAARLDDHPAVEVVRHPSRPAHPGHQLAASFMTNAGAVLSFDVTGGADRADAVCRDVRIVRHATSLGAVESTMERRAAVPGQEHLPPGLLRLSVGCEAVEDLWADLDRALGAA